MVRPNGDEEVKKTQTEAPDSIREAQKAEGRRDCVAGTLPGAHWAFHGRAVRQYSRSSLARRMACLRHMVVAEFRGLPRGSGFSLMDYGRMKCFETNSQPYIRKRIET